MNNIFFGMIIVGIFVTIISFNGCEQPDIQDLESLSNYGKNDQSVLKKDSIESWDADTTIYHSQALPAR